MEPAFTYPSFFLIVPVFLVFAAAGWFLLRQVLAALFIGAVALAVAWIFYDGLLPVQIEKWLRSERVYAIVFRDFPSDKHRFIDEYAQAYKAGGEIAVARKHEEMKIILMEHYVKHYVEHTPSEVLTSYIRGETWLLATLNAKNRDLCVRYLVNSSSFGDVWRTVGTDIFTQSLRYIPPIITEAEDHPETLATTDRARAIQLFAQLIGSMQKSGAFTGQLSCDTIYREYYLLSQMPPGDAALVLKLQLSEDQLKASTEKSFLQQLLPFQ